MAFDKGLAPTPAAGPPAAQALEPALVQTNTASRPLEALQHPRVKHDEGDEPRNTRDDPPRRDRGAEKGEPQQQRDCRSHRKSCIGDDQMPAIVRSNPVLPAAQALFVLNARVGQQVSSLKSQVSSLKSQVPSCNTECQLRVETSELRVRRSSSRTIATYWSAAACSSVIDTCSSAVWAR